MIDCVGSKTARVAALVVALAAWGCGSTCRDIAARRAALAGRPVGPGPHGQLRVPMARANEVLAASLAAQPVEKEVGPELLGDLAPIALPIRLPTLIARVDEVVMVPARPGRIGFAVRIQVREGDRAITALALRTEVAPELVRDGAAARLEIGLRPDSLVGAALELGPEANRQLADAIAGWLPESVRRRVPRFVLERGARELAPRLTGIVYKALRATLLARLGEVTRLRLGLPALPIARAEVRSASTSGGDALEVDLVTDLPVRSGLAERRDDSGGAIQLRLSGSAVAEIGNWAIDSGHLPRRYTRNLQPRPDGDYRPVFDWVGARYRRPLVIHIFQERGGCSSFEVGVRPEVSIARGTLLVALRDREIQSVRGPVALQVGAWLKSLVSRAADTSRRIAASTRLEAGGRRFDTRVTRAVLAGDEVVFDLELRAGASPSARRPPGASSGRASAGESRGQALRMRAGAATLVRGGQLPCALDS
jgi:hypothetical protein